MHYFGGMQVVLSQLEPWMFDSLINVGCGGGRFLRRPVVEYSSLDTSVLIPWSDQSLWFAV